MMFWLLLTKLSVSCNCVLIFNEPWIVQFQILTWHFVSSAAEVSSFIYANYDVSHFHSCLAWIKG